MRSASGASRAGGPAARGRASRQPGSGVAHGASASARGSASTGGAAGKETSADRTTPADVSARTSGGAAAGGTGTGANAAGKPVLERADIGRALTRIAHEIIERTKGAGDVVLLGIQTRGVPLAQRLAERIAQVEGHPVRTGSLDIRMYRDDLRLRPARARGRTETPGGGIGGRTVVLVDDVRYSGRTVRAALDSLNDSRRPHA